MKAPKDTHVLIVDDENMLLEIISKRFRIFGYQVKTTHTVQNAWKLLEKNKFDIVVTDMHPPNCDGIELLKKLKARDVDAPKVFIISGYSKFSIEEIYSLGADGLFPKPFDTKVIIETVRKATTSQAQKWMMPVHQDVKQKVVFELDSFENSRKFALGRGGFFVDFGNESLPDTDDFLDFDLCFAEGDIQSLKGKGHCRWIKSKENPKAVGIEFAQLDPSCRLEVIDKITKSNPIPFIPD